MLAVELNGNLRFGGDVATAHSLEHAYVHLATISGFTVKNCLISVVS